MAESNRSSRLLCSCGVHSWRYLQCTIQLSYLCADTIILVGILVLGAGIGLLVWGIGDLVKAGKLDDAIAEYESIIQTATTSKNQLQLLVHLFNIYMPLHSTADNMLIKSRLVEPMKNVTDSVQRVSACISNLATTMTTINNAFIPPWKMAKLVPSIFNKTVGKVSKPDHLLENEFLTLLVLISFPDENIGHGALA